MQAFPPVWCGFAWALLFCASVLLIKAKIENPAKKVTVTVKQIVNKFPFTKELPEELWI